MKKIENQANNGKLIEKLRGEYNELKGRIGRLNAFLCAIDFEERVPEQEEQNLLRSQLSNMLSYLDNLRKRIAIQERRHLANDYKAFVDGFATIDKKPKNYIPTDNRPITERVKTFKDACHVLGDEHPFVNQLRHIEKSLYVFDDGCKADILAYLKLRIIVAALNEGWTPKFVKGESRYYPWFWLYTQELYDELDDEEKGRCVLRSGYNTNASYGFVGVYASYDASYSSGVSGSRLAFRTRELAEYAGRQFAEEWADFFFKPRANEDVEEKAATKKTTINF